MMQMTGALILSKNQKQHDNDIFQIDNLPPKVQEEIEKKAKLAYKAGMSEVATGIMHNIGNLINGLASSIRSIEDHYQNDASQFLEKIFNMIEQESGDIKTFMEKNPKAAETMEAIFAGRTQLQADRKKTADTFKELSQQIKVIMDTIVDQQKLVGTNQFIQETYLTDLIIEAIEETRSMMASKRINVVLELGDLPPIKVPRNKLLTALINLLKNSVHAINEARNHGSEKNRKISGNIKLQAETVDDHIRIMVIDKGIGIPQSLIDKIFTYGYSSHESLGFGLHNAANAIREMKGKLSVVSEGLNKGATFQIKFPVDQAILSNKKIDQTG